MRETTAIDQIAEEWVDTMARLSPSFATYIGRPDGQDRLDDHSPEASQEYVNEANAVLGKLAAAATHDKVDEVTLDAMKRSLELELQLHEAGLWRRDLNVIASPAQGIREIFDLTATATEADWQNIARRLDNVDESVGGYIRSLREGIRAGDTPARRQVEWVLAEVEQLAGPESFFTKFAADAKPESGELSAGLQADLQRAAQGAVRGYEQLAAFLRNELLPNSNQVDAIGRDRYSLLSQRFLGAKIDLDETYEWGIEELARVTEEQNRVAQQIKPGASVAEAIDALNGDPARKLHGTEALREWMQRLSDEAIEKLAGSHFDIAEPIKKLECMIAPSNSGAIYYTGPTDDFSRPGRMWWSVPAGVTEFDTWRETTTVYHEGVPGHHLQIAQAVYNRAELNSWRRLASWSSGHGEGWALYAERLMADLGFLDDPGDRLGMLDGQRMRAARVVLDLGVHLGKPRLDGTGSWDFDYAREFMAANVNMSAEFVNFEVHRYFGWPAQAPSYKIGQRIWEQTRDQYAAARGASFDIKEFHREALALGGLGLDTLRFALLG